MVSHRCRSEFADHNNDRLEGGPQILYASEQVDQAAAWKIQSGVEHSLGTSIADVKQEKVKSFYRWNGDVHADPEIRVSFSAVGDFKIAEAAVAKVHNYDLPMIIFEPAGEESKYWRGEIQKNGAEAAEEVAKKLISSRAAACVQVAGAQASMKTVESNKKKAEAISGSKVRWIPIGGNSAYLDWLDKETTTSFEAAVVATPGTSDIAMVTTETSHNWTGRHGGFLLFVVIAVAIFLCVTIWAWRSGVCRAIKSARAMPE
jgi:uncharacterized protein involved in tolerance to divalent cations